MQSDYPRNPKPNSAAFGKPFTYLPTLPPGTSPNAIIEQSAIVNPVTPVPQKQKPLPVPPVRSSSTVLSTIPNKEPPITQNGNGSIQNVLPKTGPKPRPPVPPRGETTRLTTVSKGPGFNNYVNTAPKTVESKFDPNSNTEFDLPVIPYAGSVIEPPPSDKETQKPNTVTNFPEPEVQNAPTLPTLVRKPSVKSPEEAKEKPIRKPSFESGSGKISSELEAKFNKILQAQESQEKLSRNSSQESDNSQKQQVIDEINSSDKDTNRQASQESIEKSKRNSFEFSENNGIGKNSEDTVDHALPRSSSRVSITKKPSQDSIEELKAQIPENLEKEDVFLQNFEGKFKRNYSEDLIDHQSRAESCINKYRRHFSEDLGSTNKPPDDVSKYLKRNYSAESCETDETCSNDDLNVETSSTIRVETLINALSIVNTKSETNLAEVVKDEPVKSLIKTVEQSLSTDIINKVDLDDQSKETSSEDDEGATADIWVRTIESPVKRKPPPGVTQASTKENVKNASEVLIVTDEVSNDPEDAKSLSQLIPGETQDESQDSKSLAPRYTGTESLPCSRAGSRVTSRSSSPAFFGTENKPKERMSAAEALGVVPKLPGPRLSQFAKSSAEIFRRQSLGNLADSKLGGAYGRSSWAPSAVLTDVEGSSTCDTYDYRRKKFSKRCASVEGSKTLARNARLNTSASYDSDSGRSGMLDAKPSPYSYYHTLSRIGPNSRSTDLDPKYFPKSTATPPITGYSSLDSYPDSRNDVLKQRSLSQGSYRQPKSDTLPSGRPKSTCSCGHHLASSIRLDNVSKRTYSVEELAGSRVGSSSGYSSDFGRSSSTSRSSFGKSQRVTFALDEDTSAALNNKKCELDKNGLPLKKIMKKPKTSPEFVDNFDKTNIFVDSHGVAHASHCSTLYQHGCSTLPMPSHCSTLPMPTHCSTLPHPSSHCSTLPPSSHCSTLPSSLQQSNRSQPAIGIKQTSKPRPTIFGTVASDLTPKDGGQHVRKSLPQTAGQGGILNGDHGICSSVESMQDDSDNALVYREGHLVSGTLDALIQHIVPTIDYYPDRAYLFAFLLSSRLFIKPHELLGRVIALCDVQQKLTDKTPHGKERLTRFIPRLVQLLAEWSETFPYDFRDERVMAHVRGITHRCVSVESGVRHEVSSLLQNLLHRLTTLEQYEEFLKRVNENATTSNADCLSTTDITELCPTPNHIAQQLTHIELERLSFIGPEEFVQAFAKENPHLETSFKDMKRTRNLENYVQWFNRLSYLIATEVVKVSVPSV
uniref:Ras-GEF domain-containing family member 1B-A n=1 Tax=Cacopsylla melanoneura TaxID=428564 RepID=A0A8D8YIA1_9HEMI